MRITGGKAKGRLLTSLRGMEVRPTSSRVREAIFNLLGQDMTGIRALDIFAGTGIFGIEALSRGAESAIFIDNSEQSIKIINKNLALCGYQNICQVIKRDIIKGSPFETLSIEGEMDLAFIDPPYGKDVIPVVLKRLTDSGILAKKALVVAEASKNDQLPERSDDLLLIDTRRYGDTKVAIYESGH